MGKSLVIVESPTKARTIEKYLGKDFKVLASYGHVRDLPNSASEIPAEVKKEPWSRLGINVDNGFTPLYIVPSDKKSRVSELKSALKEADELLLATDEDREGESISWHLLEVLKPKVPVKRLVFHEITEKAIKNSLETARSVNEDLVQAQETRRVIDRLYGYTVSPLLWKKVAPRLSAGRVQSVAMRLLVERERERISFKSAVYSDILAKLLSSNSPEEFEADLTSVDGKPVAQGKDFDPKTGKLFSDSNAIQLTQKLAEELKEEIRNKTFKVKSVDEKPVTSRPSPPFTTSTLQQEASRKLNSSARRTMQTAQKLYENGFITYMRTDSTTLSEEAITATRGLIASQYGKQYLPDSPRLYKTKVKNAQEAHEAIRPAGTSFADVQEVRSKLGDDCARLYELIWKRTVASQMADAKTLRVSAQIESGRATFRASGSTILFPGFLRAYVEGSDDPEADLADKEKILPKLAVGEELTCRDLTVQEHSTNPPPRYTEGSLIKELERLGIGRPSTWATIVDVVLSRDYAFKRGQALVPTFLATVLTKLMEEYFKDVVDYAYTARLEDDLDAISRGEAEREKYLKAFYFGNNSPGLSDLVKEGEEKIDPRIACGLPIGKDDEGNLIEVRIGRYGPFVSNGTVRASIPDDLAPDELNEDKAREMLKAAARGPESIGKEPESGKDIFVKSGRFGPYIQLGEAEGDEKPKMVSLLKGMKPEDVTLEIALKLLKFPLVLGKNPENDEDIKVSNGRYGPYISCGTENRTIPADISPLEITLEQAIELLKQPRTRGGRTRAPAKPPLRVVGEHPESKKEIVIKEGPYGIYATDGKTNAGLPKGADFNALTLEEIVALIDERAKTSKKKKGSKSTAKETKKAAATKKAADKKTAEKKPAAKKTTARKSKTAKDS